MSQVLNRKILRLILGAQAKVLFNLRCQSVGGVKANFSNFYQGNTQYHFKCLNQEDSQENMLRCHELLIHLDQKQKSILSEVEYRDLFGSTEKQIKLHDYSKS